MSYTYDRYGNLTQTTSTKCSSPAPCYSVDASNRLYKTCSEGSQTLFYDAAGSLTNDHGVTYTWNAEGRLASTAGVTYTYDGDGRRVKKSSGKLYWYGVNGEELFETDLSGNLVAEYIYLSGRVIARRDASGTVYYFFADHLGTARVITNATGQVQRDADFYPYGTERVVTGTVDDPNKFAGMYYDTESALYHTLYRQYSSTLARWLSPDPARCCEDNPQAFNRYTYVLDNPTNLVDLLGLQPAYPMEVKYRCTMHWGPYRPWPLLDKCYYAGTCLAWGGPAAFCFAGHSRPSFIPLWIIVSVDLQDVREDCMMPWLTKCPPRAAIKASVTVRQYPPPPLILGEEVSFDCKKIPTN